MKLDNLNKFLRSLGIAFPIISMLVLTILLYVVISTGIKKISKQRREIASSEKTINVLNEKVKNLTSFSTKYDNLYDKVLLALPNQSPLLYAYAGVRKAALDNNVILDDLSLGGGGRKSGSKGLSENGISFNVTGPVENVISFLKSLNNLAPITLIDKVTIGSSGGELSGEVKISSFWAPSSIEKAPSIVSPIVPFTEADNALFDKVSTLRPPALGEVTPKKGSGRVDPFN